MESKYNRHAGQVHYPHSCWTSQYRKLIATSYDALVNSLKPTEGLIVLYVDRPIPLTEEVYTDLTNLDDATFIGGFFAVPLTKRGEPDTFLFEPLELVRGSSISRPVETRVLKQELYPHLRHYSF